MARKAFAVLLCCLVSSSSARWIEISQQSETPAIAMSMLNDSHQMSLGFNDLERLRYLNTLVVESPSIAPQKVESWARELIYLSRSTESTDKNFQWDRIAYQKNAVVALSKVDPVLAMQLFSEIGPPQTNANAALSEDVRAFGARTVFVNYYKALGTQSLMRIQQEAAKLPLTGGSYPFYAMSLVIGEVAGTSQGDNAAANDLFEDALKYYTCGSPVQNQDSEFFVLLRNVKGIIRKPLLLQAVDKFVMHLTSPECGNNLKSDNFIAILQTSKGSMRLTDERKVLLFEAFSMINEVDPNLAKSLKSDPDLINADATITQVAGSFVSKSLSPEEQARRQKIGMERSLIRGIRNMKESNPKAALDMTKLIEDPDARIVASASVLPALATSDVREAKELYAQELNELGSLSDSEQIAEATLWMTESAYHIGDLDNLQYFATKTFDDAITRFEASNSVDKGERVLVDDRPGYRELTELSEFAAAHNIKWVQNEIGQLSDTKLKAHLLIYIAKGLAHRGL